MIVFNKFKKQLSKEISSKKIKSLLPVFLEMVIGPCCEKKQSPANFGIDYQNSDCAVKKGDDIYIVMRECEEKLNERFDFFKKAIDELKSDNKFTLNPGDRSEIIPVFKYKDSTAPYDDIESCDEIIDYEMDIADKMAKKVNKARLNKLNKFITKVIIIPIFGTLVTVLVKEAVSNEQFRNFFIKLPCVKFIVNMSKNNG